MADPAADAAPAWFNAVVTWLVQERSCQAVSSDPGSGGITKTQDFEFLGPYGMTEEEGRCEIGRQRQRLAAFLSHRPRWTGLRAEKPSALRSGDHCRDDRRSAPVDQLAAVVA